MPPTTAAEAKTVAAKVRLAFIDRESKIKTESEKLLSEKENAGVISEAVTLKAVADELNKQLSSSLLRFNFTQRIEEKFTRAGKSIVGINFWAQPICSQEINRGHQNGQLNLEA